MCGYSFMEWKHKHLKSIHPPLCKVYHLFYSSPGSPIKQVDLHPWLEPPCSPALAPPHVFAWQFGRKRAQYGVLSPQGGLLFSGLCASLASRLSFWRKFSAFRNRYLSRVHAAVLIESPGHAYFITLCGWDSVDGHSNLIYNSCINVWFSWSMFQGSSLQPVKVRLPWIANRADSAHE